MKLKFFAAYSLLITLMAFILGYTLPHSPVIKYKATDYFFCGGNGPEPDNKDVTVKLYISDSAPGGVIPNGNHKLELTFEGMTWDKYDTILTSPEEMIRQWEQQNGKCKACGQLLLSLTSLGYGSRYDRTEYDHNHETGEGRGFVHRRCNLAEGCIKKMSDIEFVNFVRYVRPHLIVPRAA